MQYVQLGQTSLKISRLGYGCGGFWGKKNAFSETKAISLVHQAMDQGINFFDTAAQYNGGNAEIRLGQALKGKDRSQLVLATKAGKQLGPMGKLYLDCSPEALRKNLETSLIRLNTDYIDILLIHGPSEGVLYSDEVKDTLDTFKKDGKIRYTGASGLPDISPHIVRSGNFDVMMTVFNILQQETKPEFIAAKEAGMGTLAMSPLGHALYSNRIFKPKSLADIWYLLRALVRKSDLIKRGQDFRFVNELEGWKGSEIALLFALQNDFVDGALIGTVRPNHLTANIESLARDLPKDMIEKLTQLGESHPALTV